MTDEKTKLEIEEYEKAIHDIKFAQKTWRN